MPLTAPHSWNPSSKEAHKIQTDLAVKVERHARFGKIRHVAGISAHIRDEVGRAAVAVVELETLNPVDAATVQQPTLFRYRPGLAAFRDGPLILEALNRLTYKPDMLIIDGYGIAHPRRFGLASHIGLLVDLPTIGCVQRWLKGAQNESTAARLPQTTGSYRLLYDGDEVVGAAVRVHEAHQPLYLSVGHRVDIEACIEYVMACCRTNPLPEPYRLARHFLHR